jgi:hypothetical protein
MTASFTVGYNDAGQRVQYISYPCSNNANCAPVEINLTRGKYLFELWGARSGNDYFGSGYRRGGYVSGILDLRKTTKFFIHFGGVGSNGLNANVKGGNNGGGDGGYYGAGGGGATDVRLDSSLQSRIIVAAGAGGGERISDGHGGGVIGLTGSSTNCGGYSLAKGSQPGNQTSGGASGYRASYGYAEAGSFGRGGAGITPNGSDGGGGGGGGYFGGGGVPQVCAGSGGSSYVSGHPECMSVTGPDSTTTHSNPVHYSGLRFTEPVITSGNREMPLPSFKQTSGVGNNGPGAIRITKFLEYGPGACTNPSYQFQNTFIGFIIMSLIKI